MTSPPPAAPASQRRRLVLAGVALALVATGLAGRFALPGVLGDVVGGLLYACLVYVVLAFARPAARVRSLGAVALAVVLGVELFQLTGVPVGVAAVFPAARLVLGSTFLPQDLVVAAAGVLIAAATDAALGCRWRLVPFRS